MNLAKPYIRLVIPQSVQSALLAHARAELPNEGCGVLAGRILDDVGVVEQSFPIRNDLASPTTYRTNARDLLNASRAIREAKQDVLAIYHSHPTSAAIPSRTDLEENTWGETVAHLIIGQVNSTPELRVWWLEEVSYREVGIVINEPEA